MDNQIDDRIDAVRSASSGTTRGLGAIRVPTVNGIPFPLLDEVSGVRGPRIREVQQAWVEYYGKLNGAVHELYLVRATDPYDPDEEQSARSRVQGLLAKREALERETFLLGLLPTPIVRDGYVVDLEFADPLSLKAKKRPVVRSISSSFRLA